MFRNNQYQNRSHESPMEFEWDGQGQGPIDPNSPFPQSKPGQKRGFDTPQKSVNSFAGASFTPASQFRNPSFTTPRKGTLDLDLLSETSGIDSSPGDIADGEDTPELPRAIKAMTAFNIGSEKPPLFGRYGASYLGSSPGVAEQRRGKYANQIIHKMRKRKRVDRDYALARRGQDLSDSETDSESKQRSRGKQSTEGEKPHWFGSLLSGIESRPDLPHVLSYYAQLTLNFFFAGLFIFGILTAWTSIRADVDRASEEARTEAALEIAKCNQHYIENRCGPDLRLPALETVCSNWERCMHRDPAVVARARISAREFAQIFNSFVEPISLKAMAFIVILVVAVFAFNNLVFGKFREQQHPRPTAPPFFPATPHHQNYQWGAPPQTPQQNMGYDIYGGQTFQPIMPSQAPGQRSPSKGSRSPSKGSRSPSKGDRY